MKYLFNDQISFDPDMGTLSHNDTLNESVTISNPARRLLLLLIQHHGEVLSREIIFKKVWDDYGLVSSHNNLNQCVSKLRRVIGNLGITEDVIVTVPKVGFMLRQEIRVEELRSEEPEICSPDNVADQESDATTSPQPLLELHTGNGKLPTTPANVLLKRLGLHLLVCLCSIMVAFALFHWWYGDTGRMPVTEERYLGKVGECKVFFSVQSLPVLNDELSDDIIGYLESNQYQCSGDEYLLVLANNLLRSYTPGISRMLFMKCNIIREYRSEICWGLQSTPMLPAARAEIPVS